MPGIPFAHQRRPSPSHQQLLLEGQLFGPGAEVSNLLAAWMGGFGLGNPAKKEHPPNRDGSVSSIVNKVLDSQIDSRRWFFAGVFDTPPSKKIPLWGSGHKSSYTYKFDQTSISALLMLHLICCLLLDYFPFLLFVVSGVFSFFVSLSVNGLHGGTIRGSSMLSSSQSKDYKTKRIRQSWAVLRVRLFWV